MKNSFWIIAHGQRVRMVGILLPLLALLFLFLPVLARALVITNHVLVRSSFGVFASSTSVFTPIRTPSRVELLQYASGVSGAAPVAVPVAFSSSDGSPAGIFTSTGPITTWDSTAIALPGTVDLLTAHAYHVGEPVFIRLTDMDQNLDPLARETVLVSLASRNTGDRSLLRLHETGPDTGVFVGAAQSNNGPVVVNDRFLSVGINDHLLVDYTDSADTGDSSSIEALVDPYGLVFRTSDGGPVNGAVVTLWDVLADAEARVYYDDGSPGYPATLTSGDPAFAFAPGEFRFPLVFPGTYRLLIVPPPGYTAPSLVSTEVIQRLPGNPFSLVTGSRGENFIVNHGPAIQVDLPVDDQGGSLFISKKALKEQVEVGEFVQYNVTASNAGTGTLTEVIVEDRLPVGFRYQAGSATLDGVKLSEPLLSADGRTLIFALGLLPGGSTRELRYVAGVTVGTRPGLAMNTAIATAAGKIRSNPAQARVRVVEDLFSTRSLVLGRVLFGDCTPLPGSSQVSAPNSGPALSNAAAEESPGLGKIRLFMEDGRSVETDPKGLYHFEGLEPGSHVIQVDLDSLPAGLEIFQCEENSRFAGAPHSLFVDLQPGTMWRADFHVRSKSRVVQGEAVELSRRQGGESGTGNISPLASMDAGPIGTPADTDDLVSPAPVVTPLSREGLAAEKAPAHGILSIREGQRIAHRIQAIAVRCDARLKPELRVDGRLVANERIGLRISEEEGGSEIFSYIGVNLGEPGAHTLSFRGLDPFGNARFIQEIAYIRTSEVAAIRVMDTTGNIADGRTPVRIRVELRDQAGEVINGETVLGLRGGDLSPLPQQGGELPELRGSPTVTVDGLGYIRFAPVNASGSHVVTLVYGEVTAQVRTYVRPQYREWVMVGLAEGIAGGNTLSGDQENLEEAGQDKGSFLDGRLAFFAQGKIKERYLLTAAYDSARERDNPDNGLFGAIDPNRYYTLYGDNTQVRFAAASKDKLYLKLEGDQFYALYGDYDTNLSASELSRYSRSLTGFKGQYQGERLSATAFAAETDHAFIKDELPGDSTSGLYRLSHDSIILNSEKIAIETRDRFHSEVILNRRQLTRFLDYTFDAQDGTIYFREPIFSRDAEFNPLFIVVEYEVASGAARTLTGGGRVAYTLGEQGSEVGLSLIHQGTSGAPANLQGVDLRYALNERTTIRAEAATTSRDQGNGDLSGKAFLVEIDRHQEQLAGKAYFRQQDGEFGLGQQAGSESGTRKYGVDGSYALSRQTALNAEIFRQETPGNSAVRDVVHGAVFHHRLDKLSASSGLRWVRDENVLGEVLHSTMLTGSIRRPFLEDRLDLYARGEVAVDGDESSDYPSRLILGGEYALTPAVRFFAAEELTWGEKQNSQTSRVGLKAIPWKEAAILTSIEEQGDEYGVRTFASMGLTQGVKISDALHLDFGLERAETLRHPGDTPQNVGVPPASGAITDDFTAVSSGVTWKKKLWSMTGRGEYRDGEQEDKVGLLWGFYREQTPGFGLASVFRYFDSQREGDIRNTRSELEFSLAWRPLESKWIILDKVRLVEERESGLDLSMRTRKLVNNLNLNYLYDRRNQVSLSHGLKYVIDNFDGVEYDGITQFLAVEYRHDINKEWDLGLAGAVRVSSVGHNALYSSGVSLGHSFARNIWLSVGYNFSGFRDDDFSGASHTAQGIYIKCRAKFDQFTARQLLAWWEK